MSQTKTMKTVITPEEKHVFHLPCLHYVAAVLPIASVGNTLINFESAFARLISDCLQSDN